MLKEIFEKTKFTKFLKYFLSIVLLAFIGYFTANAVKSPGAIEHVMQQAGVFGPLVLVLLIMAGVLLTPVPAALIIAAAGYLYGPLMGGIYSYIANVFAALMTFLIYRKYGKIGKNIKKYESFVQDNQSFLYALYIMPVIPISLISMASAAAKVKWKKYVKIVTLSFLPNVFFFSYFGSTLSKQNMKETIALIFIAIVASIFIIRTLRKKMKK